MAHTTPDPDTALDPALDPLVCFDLYAAQRALTAAYRPLLADLGLTYPQYLVLVLLWERDGLAIKELAGRLQLDHATLTPLLRRMERGGLLVRERSLFDERSVTLRLTPAGLALREREEAVRCGVTEALGLDPGQVEALRDLLRTASTNLARAARPAGAAHP